MATVRITKELTEDILRNAKNKFGAAIRKAEESKPEDKWGDYIYDKLFGEYYHTMKELPQSFFNYHQHITITSVGGIHVNAQFSLSELKPFPKELPADVSRDVAERQWNAQYCLGNDLMWGELYAEVMRWHDKLLRLKDQQRLFSEGVGTVLSNFSTLAPALKEWPPLWELVPEKVKEKHKEITVKEKKDKPSVDQNTLGRLTGAMTAVKLGGL